MDDGTRIAVDTFLPTDFNHDGGAGGAGSNLEQLPTVIHMTRYVK